ncbi:MAG TPA: hypothetical protein VMU39_02900 [Solirubrobacteraceae bacterium]|nr:hypothetical protein [Solirubrobacteraceae bacterium]
MKTTRERAEEKRAEKLERVREQVQERLAGDPADDRGGAPALPAARTAAEATWAAVSMREREGLIARIRQTRRSSAGTDQQALPSTSRPGSDELGALEVRIVHLEQVVQGLQDSVHRESARLSKRIGELEARTQPAALGKALSEDARKRGL